MDILQSAYKYIYVSEMALKTFVKISGVTNLSDARYCAGMGVQVLGFVCEKNYPNYVDPTTYIAITEWLAGVAFAAEFDQYSPQQIEATLALYPDVQYVQITNPQYITSLQRLQKPLILRLEVDEYDDIVSIADVMRDHCEGVAYFLLENTAPYRHSDLQEDLLHLAQQYPILLAFGVQPDNVRRMAEDSALAGIALRGGEEIKPGYRNFDALADILEAIEEA